MIKGKLVEAIGKRRETEVTELDSKMARMDKALQLAAAIPNDLPEASDVYVGSWFWPIYLTWPADVDLMDEIKLKFEEAGFTLYEPQYSKKQISVKARLTAANEFYMYVELQFAVDDPNATCQLIKVGEHREEVTSFEYSIKCPEED